MYAAPDFILKSYTHLPQQGIIKASAPSNIALVKYWGKKANQIPANPSISFTLSHCKTITSLTFKKKEGLVDFSFDLLFEGKPKESFKPKILKFLERIEPYMPFLKSYHFEIDTENTFPHSSGIASSASGMAALAVNLMQLEQMICPEMTPDFFNAKASFLARLGSGSACRSIKGQAVIWGEHKDTLGSTNEFGVPFEEIHLDFQTCQDTILLVDVGEKQVSSTLGHELMNGHAYADARFRQAHDNLTTIKEILREGDWDRFTEIVESEALTLHAMMMASKPYFILMRPNTLEIIQKVWQFRKNTGTSLCFTLDAGANVHLLYPKSVKDAVLQFIKQELVGYCQNSQYICDEIGEGAEKLHFQHV